MATLQDIADRLNISKGTVSKALNGAPDISETLQKTVLETAVEMGYTKIRRQKAAEKKLCILIEKHPVRCFYAAEPVSGSFCRWIFVE